MINEIGFSSNLVNEVLAGQKTVTYRLGAKYADSLSQGSILDAVNSQNEVVFGKLKVLEVFKKPMSDIILNTPGHEQYSSLNEFIASMQRHYPTKSVTANSIISVIRFQVL